MPHHPQMLGESGGLERPPVTFIHSNTSAKMLHARPGKMEEAGAGEEKVWALSPEARPVVPRTGWWEGSPVAPPNANPAARPPALLLPCSLGPPLPPQQPPAPGLPGRTAAGPPWEDEGARFLLLPPAPRAEAVARETGLAVRRGARPLPRPVHLCCPALAAPRPGEGRRGRGAAGGPPTHLRARAATPGGQRHPEPPQPLLPPPPEAPLRKRDHWSEAATLPDMVPPSSPPTSPFPHAGLPSRSNCGTEVRLPRSDAR